MRPTTLTLVALGAAATTLTPAALASRPGPHAAPNRHFAGTTSQLFGDYSQHPGRFDMKLATNLRRLLVQFQYVLTCDGDVFSGFYDYTPEVTASLLREVPNVTVVKRNGKVSKVTFNLSDTNPISPDAKGVSGDGQLLIAGTIRFATHTASGTFQIDEALSNGQHCVTQAANNHTQLAPVTWTAKDVSP